MLQGYLQKHQRWVHFLKWALNCLEIPVTTFFLSNYFQLRFFPFNESTLSYRTRKLFEVSAFRVWTLFIEQFHSVHRKPHYSSNTHINHNILNAIQWKTKSVFYSNFIILGGRINNDIINISNFHFDIPHCRLHLLGSHCSIYCIQFYTSVPSSW